MNSIPIDLVIEIFSRLPSKSIAKFLCVSKLWGSMLRRPYFTELFLTRYWARPRLLFALNKIGKGELIFYSSPQPQNPYEKPSSLVIAADFHIKLPKHQWIRFCGYAFGLFWYYHNTRISQEYADDVHVICNPSTGQCASLPKLRRDTQSISFLGFDPIDKQFKVLSMSCLYREERDDHRILTLGSGYMMWRKIQCPLAHEIWLEEESICINGVLYYIATRNNFHVIVCFDVRSEKFKFIDAKGFHAFSPKLINYKGKLVGIGWKSGNLGERHTRAMCMWVLEDLEKHEWLQYVYTFPDNELVDYDYVVGVTATCEIVLSMKYTTYKQFYVFYFNPERNTLQLVDIQNFGGYEQDYLLGKAKDQELGRRVYTVVDHVEDLSGVYAFVDHLADLNVTDAKQLSSIQVRTRAV